MASAQLAAVASVTNYLHLQLVSQMSPDARDLIVQCCNGEPGAPGAQALSAASFHNMRTSRACSATRIVQAHFCAFGAQCVCASHVTTRIVQNTVARSARTVFAHPTCELIEQNATTTCLPRICSDGRVRGTHAVGGCQVWDHQARACLCRSQRSRNGRVCRQVQGECNPTPVQSYKLLVT
jgi:hypothetical protein